VSTGAEARLPWHEALWHGVATRIDAGRLPHASLLSGPAGLGKLDFATQLAQALLCEARTTDGHGCGVCRGCLLFAAGSHPDFRRVEPAEDGKVIRVEQVRELIEFLALTSGNVGRRVVLLQPADRLNANAANSLLKTLEEPPAGSHLLLLSAHPAGLLPTIRSRCQTLAFTAPDTAQALAWLAPQVGGADPQLLLALAAGSPLRALQLAAQLPRRRELFRAFLDVATGKLDPLRAAELWLEDDVALAVHWLLGWYLDLLRLNMAATPPQLTNPDLREALCTLTGRLRADYLARRWEAALRLRELLATQANPQLLLEEFFIDWAGVAARRV